MTSSTCTTIVGFTLPCRALLPAQQWWALHFHEELYLHNNSGLYNSMTSFTLFEKPTVSHFPSTSPTRSSLPVPTGSWHQNLPQFLHKVKTSAVAFIGIMPTLGSALCGPLFQWGLRLYRPLILTSNQPSMRCIPKPLKWVSHFSFDLLINFPLSQLRVSLPICHCRKFSSQVTNIWWLFQKVIGRTK
jgi:hypothetical protein